MNISIIEKWCKENNISISALEKQCGLGNATIKGWEKSSPILSNLQKVADYTSIPIIDLIACNK